MSVPFLDHLKIKAKLLQKAKRKRIESFALKDAYEILARTAGFRDWRSYKAMLTALPDFCPPGTSAYWKNWHASYEDAVAEQEGTEFFLLPYQQQFFLCDGHYIKALGIADDDMHLARVGRDWVYPKDKAAFKALMKKIQSPLRR